MSEINIKEAYPVFSEAEFLRRYSVVREAMQTASLLALVLYSTVSSYHEVLFLSDFLATREAFLVFPFEGEPTLLVQMYNHVPNARRVARLQDVRWAGLESAVTVTDNLRGRKLEQGRIGLVGPISYKHYAILQAQLPQVVFVDFTPQMARLRLIKSEEEMLFLRRGAALSDLAVDEVLDTTDFIHQAGFTICDDLVHGFGGGYLAPVVRTRRTSVKKPEPFVFREDMVVVIQPNIITEDGRMGVQVGEMVRVRQGGVESFHHYPMRFVQCQGAN